MSGEPGAVSVSGYIDGPVDLARPKAQWGDLVLFRKDGRTQFSVDLPISGPAEEAHEAAIAKAVEAAVAAATGAGVVAVVTGMRWPLEADRYRVASFLTTSWNVHVGLDSDDANARRGAEVFRACAVGADKRLADLYRVYTLGARAVQTIAPIVGFWAFSVISEEEAPAGKHNLDHVQGMLLRLRAAGHVLHDPPRHPSRLRAAALHAKVNDPAPTVEEALWLQSVAQAYLLDRAGSPLATRRREGCVGPFSW